MSRWKVGNLVISFDREEDRQRPDQVAHHSGSISRERWVGTLAREVMGINLPQGRSRFKIFGNLVEIWIEVWPRLGDFLGSPCRVTCERPIP